jgi:hypothetical protein
MIFYIFSFASNIGWNLLVHFWVHEWGSIVGNVPSLNARLTPSMALPNQYFLSPQLVQ